MQQLSGTDNVMLIGEKGNVFNHVGCLMIYDVTTSPGGNVRFKDILQHFEARLYLHPVFRRRLVPVPFDLDRPYWIAESNIDIEYHIRHVALPKPGDWRQLMIQVARLHSRPLDRAHPLWEVYVIEGLDNIPKLPAGAFAVFLKIHHAIVDGMAAVHLMNQLHERSADVAATDPTPRVVVGDRDLSLFEIVSRSIGNRVARAGKSLRMTTDAAGRVLSFGRGQLPVVAEGRIAEVVDKLKRLLPPAAPKTRFSGKITSNRVVEGFGMPFSRIRRIRARVPGSTLNDVFLAVAGGAARSYLLEHKDLPGQSLAALMPISLRSDASAGGNQVAGMPVKVRSDIADPIERLKAVHEEARTGKQQAEAMGLDLLMNVVEVLPPFVANTMFFRAIVSRVNMAVSNVRGPDEALYLAGAKAMCMYPVSIPTEGCGLNFTGVSYNGVLWVSMVSCRSMVPDPGKMLACMRGSWEELLAAADALPDPSATVEHRPARRGKKGTTASRRQRMTPMSQGQNSSSP